VPINKKLKIFIKKRKQYENMSVLIFKIKKNIFLTWILI
jgi:hypothetical protein